MKKLLLISLLICLPCFASEQSVLQDAQNTFNAQFRTVDTSKASQVEKDVMGLILVSQRYIATLQTDNLIDVGNLLIKKINVHPNQAIKNEGLFTAYMCKAMGYLFQYKFKETYEALAQMNKYKAYAQGGQQQYNRIYNMAVTAEKAYNRYKDMGYDMNSQSTQTMIKRQLGL